MTRAKGKTPRKVSTAKKTEALLSPALTRSIKRSRVLSRITKSPQISSPGWQTAHPDLFKSPGAISPARPKPTGRQTRRSSIFYQKTTTTIISSPKKAFKAPAPVAGGKRQSIYKAPKESAPVSRRSSVYRKAANMTSPVLTRARRTSMYVTTTEFSKVFRTPDEASLRRQSMFLEKTVASDASPPLKPAPAKKPSPKAKKPSPKAKKASPKAKKPSPKAKKPSPKVKKASPKARSPPKAKKLLPKLATPPKPVTPEKAVTPDSPEDLEVTFNTTSFYSKSPARPTKSNITKKSSPPKSKSLDITPPVEKTASKPSPSKPGQVAQLKTPSKSPPKSTKAAATKRKSPTKSPKSAGQKKPKVTKSKIPVTSPADRKDAKKAIQKRPSLGKSSPSPTKKAKTTPKSTTGKSTAKVATPKIKRVTTPKASTPKAKTLAAKTKVTPKAKQVKGTPTSVVATTSTIKVTPTSQNIIKKSAKTSPRVRLTQTSGAKRGKSSTIVTPGITPSPAAKPKKTYPKTPIRLVGIDSPKTPAFQTPTGVKSPKKRPTLAAKVKTTPSTYKTPPVSKKTPGRKAGAAGTPTGAKVTKSVSKVTKTVFVSRSATDLKENTSQGKTTLPVQQGKTPVRVASSPDLGSAKKPAQKTVSRVRITTPPKAAKVLGKTPSSKVKERKVTPSRITRGSDPTLNISIPRTSTPVGEPRKRPAEFPLSEIRQSKRLQVTEMSTMGALTLSEEKTMDTLNIDMKSKDIALLDETEQGSISWFGSWCTIL